MVLVGSPSSPVGTAVMGGVEGANAADPDSSRGEGFFLVLVARHM